MLQEVKPLSVPGLLKVNSMQALRQALKDLMIHYEKESDRYGEKVGRMMRILEPDTQGKEIRRLSEVDWKRSGMVLVNADEPGRGTLELLIEAMEDYKAKARRTGEVLAQISELEELGVPDGASILVYLRHGVPLRVVIDKERNPEVDGMVQAIY
jgi:hypothetical protein